MTISSRLIGDACGHHGPYSFYRTLGIAAQNGRKQSITVGQFFFLRFGATDPVCVGELHLLWEDKNVEATLCSCRLYYLPENTPEGRHGHHGEDEVLAVSEKVVLRVEDLVQWIVSDVQWERGLKGCFAGEEQSLDPTLRALDTQASYQPDDCPDQMVKTEVTEPPLDSPTSQGLVQTFIANNLGSSTKSCQLEEEKKPHQPHKEDEESTVRVLSYASYCRYRGVLKRLENVPDSWLRNALVEALGGFIVSSRNCRLHFCRDTFDHPLLDGHALLLNHLAPTLRGRPRKKSLSIKQGSSPSSESNENEQDDWGDTCVKEFKLTNGIKELAGEDLEEQEFLQSLFKFMRQRNTPIERVPHLGFKQINLYFFYTYTQKLGGYDKITIKKMWKRIYDELGGNPGSTSAATCTRRHYERLLLPFERHLKGEDRTRSHLSITKACKSNSLNTSPSLSSPMCTSSSSIDPDSPVSDRCSSQPTAIEPLHTLCSRKKSTEEDVLPTAICTDSSILLLPPSPPQPVAHSTDIATSRASSSVIIPIPSTVLLVPSKVTIEQLEETNFDDRKPDVQIPSASNSRALEQVSLQFTHNQQRKRAKDKYAEKERMWDEIRRQNAVERDRIRQLTAAARSVTSRGVSAKVGVPELSPGQLTMLNPRSHITVSDHQVVTKASQQQTQPSETFLASTPKRKKLEEAESQVGSFTLHSKVLPNRLAESCLRKQEIPVGWRSSKSAAMLRPSVIQHTHSAAAQPAQYKPLDSNHIPHRNHFRQEKRNSCDGAGSLFSIPAPAAHTYSQTQYRLCSEGTSKDSALIMETGRCPRYPCQPESDSTRSIASPAVEEDSVLDLRVKKNTPTWTNGHTHGHSMRERRSVSDEEHGQLVKTESTTRDSDSPPEDLSTKAESKCHFMQDRAHGTTTMAFPLPGGREPAHHVMPSQYFITSDKTPVFFPDYGPLIPPHYFGVSFPMTYPFAFPSNLCPTSYKEPSPYLFVPK